MGLEEAHKIEIVSVNVQDVVIWWLNIQKKEIPLFYFDDYFCDKCLQVD